jgi:hypothetical protein
MLHVGWLAITKSTYDDIVTTSNTHVPFNREMTLFNQINRVINSFSAINRARKMLKGRYRRTHTNTRGE